jgi:hypothetical protein
VRNLLTCNYRPAANTDIVEFAATQDRSRKETGFAQPTSTTPVLRLRRHNGGKCTFVVFSGALNDKLLRSCSPATFLPGYQTTLASPAWRRRWPRPRRCIRPSCGSSWPSYALLCARRSSASSPTSFEQIHNIERALAVGSVHAIIPARELRPYLIGAVERGISRTAANARPMGSTN